MNKLFSAILICVFVLFVGYFSLKSTDKKSELENNSATELEGGTQLEGEVVGGVSLGEESVSGITGTVTAGDEATSEEVTVIFSDTGYSPKDITVKVGTVVTYKNESKISMWPASAKHPTHADYPTTGGCLGSTFDACRGVLPGESWSFQFDVAGSWGYHDHLKPSFFGKVVVE